MKDKEEILQDLERDYRRAWCTTIQIVLQLLILFFVFLMFISTLAGCVKFAHTDSQGNVTEYLRIGPQSIGAGSVTLPDGSVLNFKGQNAELPPVKITATSIMIGKER